jgi:hypothetical protein
MATCPWMTRCWTFQEKFLARQMSFCLRTGRINPRIFLFLAELSRKYIFAPHKLIAGIKFYKDSRDRYEQVNDRNTIRDVTPFEGLLSHDTNRDGNDSQDTTPTTLEMEDSNQISRKDGDTPNRQISAGENLQRYDIMLALEALQIVLNIDGIFTQGYDCWLEDTDAEDPFEDFADWISTRLQPLLFSSPVWIQKFLGPPKLNVLPRTETLKFVKVWNELGRRTTSQTQDIAGILALCIGISPWQVMILDQNPKDITNSKASPLLRFEGMKRIFRSLRELPFSILLTRSFVDYPKCATEGWVPAFPSGSLSIDDGVMIWNKDRTELIFPSTAYNHIYLVDLNLSEDTLRFDINFEISLPEEIDPVSLGPVTVHLPRPLRISQVNKPFALMFPFSEQDEKLAGPIGVIFEVLEERSHAIILQFHSHFRYDMAVPDHSATSAVHAGESKVTQYILKCSKFSQHAFGRTAFLTILGAEDAWPDPVSTREDLVVENTLHSQIFIAIIYFFWLRMCYCTLPDTNEVISEFAWTAEYFSRAPPWVHTFCTTFFWILWIPWRMPPISWYFWCLGWVAKFHQRIALLGLHLPRRHDWENCLRLTYGLIFLRHLVFNAIEKGEIIQGARAVEREDLLTSSPYDAADVTAVRRTRALYLRTYPRAWLLL